MRVSRRWNAGFVTPAAPDWYWPTKPPQSTPCASAGLLTVAKDKERAIAPESALNFPIMPLQPIRGEAMLVTWQLCRSRSGAK
ncbi:hypothetical protein GCM10011611_00870 [Aliidongia dinghuensis]|uniref:Uncharacterized protein n=1 Tax=Aliidongia dinghuensis TaxID=1867774 RepID=A0A8J2YP72_9PROT|nr:hypothetical protein GCM10011611_00870 [Aliidongia dinghuensis]